MSNYEKKLLWILIAVIAIGAILFGKEFLSFKTLAILGNQLPEYGLISIALMLTLIVSGMNLSIVAMTMLAGVTGALLMDNIVVNPVMSVILGVLLMIGMGALTGAINGVIVSYVEVSPILATLGTMLFFKGFALNITKGGAITSFQKSFTVIGSGSIWGIPITLIILVVILILLYYMMDKKEIGKQMYRIGRNKNSAIYSGINVKKVVFQAYVIAGVIAGIAAVIMTSRYNSIRVDYGSTYLIKGIVIVSLGGVELKGGTGSIRGVVIALLIVSVVLRIMNMVQVDSNLIDGVMGGILLINMIVQYYLHQKK